MKPKTLRKIISTAILSALAFILMFLEFGVPFAPGFLKFDFSELPALLASFAYGPVFGIIVCFIKNALHLTVSSSMCVGELSNFILGIAFVVPAGIIYKKRKTFKRAIAGSSAGCLIMSCVSLPLNLILIYPLYGKVWGLTNDIILGMYQAILPSVSELWIAILIFNVPFTFVKGLADVVICFLIYKRISHLLKGN